ncbi:MAG: hypothetical protein ACHQRJ_25565 [Alphaproteobacteria bacterium]
MTVTLPGRNASYPVMRHRLRLDSWGIIVMGFLGAIMMLMALVSLLLD